MLKPLAIICVLVILLALGAWFALGLRSHDEITMVDEGSRSEVSEVVGARRAKAELDAPPVGLADDRDPHDDVGEGASPRLHGRVVVVESNGKRDETPSGIMKLKYWPGDVGVHVDVPVEEGRFDMALVAEKKTFSVQDMIFEGRRCYMKSEKWGGQAFFVEGDEPLELVVMPWPLYTLRGRVHVLEPGGRVDETPDGSFEICGDFDQAPMLDSVIDFADDAEAAPLARVNVIGGRFECEIPVGLSFYELKDPTLSGRRAILDDYERQGLNDVVLIFRLRRIPILDVRDRPTGKPLGDVVVLEAPDGKCPVDPAVREVSRVVARGVASPVTLEIPEEEQTVWVGSPGHDWNEVYVSATELDPIDVVLEPAGSVTFKVVGASREGLYAVLFEQGHAALFNRALDFREARLEGVPEGRHPFRLFSADGSMRYLEATVEVAAGRTTEHVIDLDAIPEETLPVRVHGRLVIPEEWDVEPRLTIRPDLSTLKGPQKSVTIEPTAFHDLGDGLYEFAADLAPARYTIQHEEARHSWDISIEAAQEAHIELRLPPPATLIIALKTIGQEAPVSLGFGWLTCEGWNGKSPIFTSQERKSVPGGKLQLRCPTGPVLISVLAEGYTALRRLVNVTSSPHHETIFLEKEMGVAVDVTLDGAPWPDAWEKHELDYKLEFLDSKPRGPAEVPESLRHFHISSARRSVPYAGRYRLRVVSLPAGCRPVPPIDLVIESGRYTAVTLALESL